MTTRRPVFFGLAAAALLTLSPAVALAQTDNRLALGLGVTNRIAGSSRTDGSSAVGLEIRLGHEQQEWGWAYSLFSWFDLDLESPPDFQSRAFGDLRMRPIMAGYGYTWIRGRSAITADLVGGFSLNSFHVDRATIAEYQQAGAAKIDGEASNTLVVKPEVQIWRDLSSRLGLKVTGGYLISRPTVTVASTLGRDTRSFRADTVLITFGLVYSIM